MIEQSEPIHNNRTLLAMRRLSIAVPIIFLWLACLAVAQSTGTMRGTVLDQDGMPIQGAMIRILGTTRGAISKADGSFLIAGVRFGSYQYRVTSVGYQDAQGSVVIVSDSIANVDVELRPRYISSEWFDIDRRLPSIIPERNGTVHIIKFGDYPFIRREYGIRIY